MVGILAPTGTPVDRAVFVNMLGFEHIHHAEDLAADEEHEHEQHKAHAKHAKPKQHDEYADEMKEVTAVLVCLQKNYADRGGTDVTAKLINNSKVAQAVVARPRDRRPVRGHRGQAAMDPAGHGRADGRRGGHRHHGQHLQLDERPAARNRRHAAPWAPADSPS